MDSLLNSSRPPVFCPGCSHERVVQALDEALTGMNIRGEEIVIVSDIGCSGLFDTFFHTHAFHGLHGRALTYATGIKMARPELTVIVTMGDGGLGIGGAHVLSACRRNLDLTLLVLNNFNYGMTGGQCSSTTPQEAKVASGFLNTLEKPLDICQVAGAAGAGHLDRISAYDKTLVASLQAAIRFEGFGLLDIWGICPGRYTRANRLTPKTIAADLAQLPDIGHFQKINARMEYAKAYQKVADGLDTPTVPTTIEATCQAPQSDRQEVVILGSAGQRIITAGELLCLAGASAGRHATQKNDYPITVMRGHSVSEIILSDSPIDYTGIENPSVVIALAAEGVARRHVMVAQLPSEAIIVKAPGVKLPASDATVMEIDFKKKSIKQQDWALGALAVLAAQNIVLSKEMLDRALHLRFNERLYSALRTVVEKIVA